MDDRLDDRFAAAVRTALLDEVRASPAAPPARSSSRAPRRPRWQPVLALGIAAVTIVAIAIGFSVASRTRSSAPAAVPFDGDCAAILTARTASDLIGKPLTIRPVTSPLSSPEALAIPVVHGLQCTWAGAGDVADEAGIVLTVLPVALRPKDAKPVTGCTGANDGKDLQYQCSFDVVSGGRWATGLLTGLTGGTEARTQEDVASLRRTIEALSAATTSTPLDTTGWWSPLGCTALGARADLATALGRPGLATEQGNGDQVTAGQGAALSRAAVVNCILEQDTATTSFTVEVHAFGGAGPLVAEQLQGSDVHRLADIDGAKVYRVVDGSTHSSALWIVARGGALELAPGNGGTSALLPAVRPVLKALDAQVRK